MYPQAHYFVNLQYKWCCFLAKVLRSRWSVCRGGNHPTYLQTLMILPLRPDCSLCPSDGENQIHRGVSSDLICVLVHPTERLKVQQESERPLICFFFLPLLRKASPLLSWAAELFLGWEKSLSFHGYPLQESWEFQGFKNVGRKTQALLPSEWRGGFNTPSPRWNTLDSIRLFVDWKMKRKHARVTKLERDTVL